jgi:hypothetical protein
MSEVFLRQDEAWAFVRSLSDPTERLLVELALAKTLSFLVADSEYQATFKQAPLDLLTYAKAVHAFLSQKETLREVLDGKITSVDDLSPFPDS